MPWWTSIRPRPAPSAPVCTQAVSAERVGLRVRTYELDGRERSGARASPTDSSPAEGVSSGSFNR